MTAVTATNAATQPPRGLFGASGGDFDLFLRLLTTQMQNQDPLDPMDANQYTQQLAQYSQVEQSIQQTGVLRDILARLSGDDLSRAGQLIGRTVEFDSSVAGLPAQGSAEWRWTLPRAAASIEAEILDSEGRTIARPDIGSGANGALQWDGRLPDGSRAPEGAYVLRLTARDSSGNPTPAALTSVGRVQEVLAREGMLWAGLGGVSLPLTKLVRIAA